LSVGPFYPRVNTPSTEYSRAWETRGGNPPVRPAHMKTHSVAGGRCIAQGPDGGNIEILYLIELIYASWMSGRIWHPICNIIAMIPQPGPGRGILGETGLRYTEEKRG
jgi:hypothetical protein